MLFAHDEYVIAAIFLPCLNTTVLPSYLLALHPEETEDIRCMVQQMLEEPYYLIQLPALNIHVKLLVFLHVVHLKISVFF